MAKRKSKSGRVASNIFERDVGYHFGSPVTNDLVETHGHFHLQTDKVEELIKFVYRCGIRYSIYVACDMQSSYDIAKLARSGRYSEDRLDYAIGLHPNLVNDIFNTTSLLDKAVVELEKLIRDDYLGERRIKYIGECGLDFYRTPRQKIALQEKLFLAQLEMAQKYKKLLVLHNRDSGERLFQLIARSGIMLRPIIYHCYSRGDIEHALTALRYNCYFGIGGAFTYKKNEALREVVKKIPRERILVESDAPYLPPQGWRGYKNSTVLLHRTIEYMAKTLNITVQKLSSQIFCNTSNLKEIYRCMNN